VSLEGPRVLVTGGAGFIGSHIVESLVQQGARVRVYDNFSSGTPENLAAVAGDVEVLRGDILDEDELLRAMRGTEMVSHQAAQLEITRALEDPAGDLRTNTVGTLHVLRAAVACGVAKVVLASSACVYGQARVIPQTEEHPTVPNWPYGVSKLAAEHYARLFRENHGLAVCALRYGIVYGPREWYGRVLTIFLRRALEGKPLIVFGDGTQQRDFIYVADVVDLHNRCLTRRAADGKVYNAGTGIGTSIADLAALVRSASGGRVEIVYDDPPQGGYSPLIPERIRLPAELQAMVLSPERARRELDWQPRVALADGLRRELEWIRERPGRWETMHV